MKYVLLLVFLIFASSGSIESGTISWPVDSANLNARGAAELYSKHCASCHGKDGRAKTFKGKLKRARDLSEPEWQGRVGDERIFNSIMNGKGNMPAYKKKLSDQEIDSLVPYVRGLRK